VLLLFYAFGVVDNAVVYALIRRTASWADIPTLRRLLYATQQHTIAVNNQREALSVLTKIILQHNSTTSTTIQSGSVNPQAATEDLLNANVLPHLTTTEGKVHYLAHLIGILLNHLFLPSARRSSQYDDFRTYDRRRGGYHMS
jgi:hypothetical protein